MSHRAEITTPEAIAEETSAEATLRPSRLDEFVGQAKVRENLQIAIDAAKGRGEPLDHALFFGPPGLGKTTLAILLAKEMGVSLRTTSGPVLERPGDLVGLLTNLRRGDILFIDEIHRMRPALEEFLYPAMEDWRVDVRISEGAHAETIPMALEPFTLIGATTRYGMLTPPMRARFGMVERLNFYPAADLQTIVTRSAGILGARIDEAGALEVARRSRGTPRVANRLLRRVRDFADVGGHSVVDARAADAALTRLEVDTRGLDAMDRRYLACIAENYGGGPVGVETLAAALSEQRDVIEDVIEPYLMQLGLLMRTPRGRLLSEGGYRHLGKTIPKEQKQQLDLLAGGQDEA